MRVCAAAFLVDGDKVLLAKRSADRPFYPGVWDAVGGHVDGDETPESTMLREVREEIGVEAVRWSDLAVLPEPNPHEYGPGRCHYYAVTAWRGGPALLGSEHSEIGWFRMAEVAELELADPAYVDVLAAFLESETAGDGQQAG